MGPDYTSEPSLTISPILPPFFPSSARFDYRPGPYTTEFVRKQTQADIRIPIFNDELFEGPETFIVYLSLTPETRASAVDPSVAEITIFDGSGMCSGLSWRTHGWLGHSSVMLGLLISFYM